MAFVTVIFLLFLALALTGVYEYSVIYSVQIFRGSFAHFLLWRLDNRITSGSSCVIYFIGVVVRNSMNPYGCICKRQGGNNHSDGRNNNDVSPPVRPVPDAVVPIVTSVTMIYHPVVPGELPVILASDRVGAIMVEARVYYNFVLGRRCPFKRLW